MFLHGVEGDMPTELKASDPTQLGPASWALCIGVPTSLATLDAVLSVPGSTMQRPPPEVEAACREVTVPVRPTSVGEGSLGSAFAVAAPNVRATTLKASASAPKPRTNSLVNLRMAAIGRPFSVMRSAVSGAAMRSTGVWPTRAPGHSWRPRRRCVQVLTFGVRIDRT